jgi:hypothetical protein
MLSADSVLSIGASEKTQKECQAGKPDLHVRLESLTYVKSPFF